jgi:hypothetical protein
MMSPRIRLQEQHKLKKEEHKDPECEENLNLSEEENGFEELPDFSQL